MKSTQRLAALAIGITTLASIPTQLVEANTETRVRRTRAENPVIREDTTSAPTEALRPTEVVRGTRIYANTDDQLREALWALGRYAEAGLDLPTLTIRLHDSNEACGGNAGVHRFEDGTDAIDICTEARWTILHELAHVWASENLTDADRDAFVARQGLEAWSGSEIEWKDRGTEQAADLVAWALSDSSHIPRHVWRGSVGLLEEAYQALTGQLAKTTHIGTYGCLMLRVPALPTAGYRP